MGDEEKGDEQMQISGCMSGVWSVSVCASPQCASPHLEVGVAVHHLVD
jgi:hypothetical protein